jgi:hypothetical protein
MTEAAYLEARRAAGISNKPSGQRHYFRDFPHAASAIKETHGTLQCGIRDTAQGIVS